MNRFLRPEIELLTYCVRNNISPIATDHIRVLLKKDLDWNYLLKKSLRHGVMPLLYKTLNANFQQVVPDHFLNKLKACFYANVKRNILLTEELLEIIDNFESHGISAISFKGPAIAAHLYGNIALRQFDDLDILVHKRDAKRAKELLISKGYQPMYKLDEKEETAYIESKFEYFLSNIDNSTYLGIHWQIVPKYFSIPIDAERFWPRLEMQSLFGREIQTISPEDLLFVLCLHGTRHLWQRLAWICDIAQLIEVHRNLSWDWIIKQASILSSERILNLGLYLAKDILDTELPEEISKKVLKDTVVKSLALRVKNWLFQDNNGGPKSLEYPLFHLRVRERVRDRVQYCTRLITTPNVKDWAFFRLSKNFFPLYYLLRPLRLAKDYLRL